MGLPPGHPRLPEARESLKWARAQTLKFGRRRQAESDADGVSLPRRGDACRGEALSLSPLLGQAPVTWQGPLCFPGRPQIPHILNSSATWTITH